MKNLRYFLAFVTFLIPITLVPAHGVSFPDSSEVSPEKAPFLISLWSVDSDTFERKENFCSGVLIDGRTFLTAAHCLVSGEPFVVVRGQNNKSERGEVLSVYSYKIHPRYSAATIQNDIAVGVLNFPSRYTSPIWSNTKKNSSFSKTLNQIYGWGLDQNELDTGYPMSAKLSDYTNKVSKYFKKFNPLTQIAAGKYNTSEKTFAGACFGDSGGPLIASNGGNLSVIGITSYISAKGCDVEIPTVFTRVKYYIPFIQSTKDTLVAQFDGQKTNFPNPELVSLLPDTETYLTRREGLYGYYSSAILQEGGGVSSEADVNQLMFQTYKTNSPNEYSFGINAYLTNPIETCIEKQKGKWLIQVALDSRQRVDFSFAVNSGTGCYSSNKVEYNVENILKVPPAQGACNDVGVKPWSSTKKDAAISTDIDTFSFLFNKACLGTSKKIWIRLEHSVNGQGDIEPGLDMWAGPFSTAILGEVSTSAASNLKSFTAYLDKLSYKPGEIATLTIWGKDSAGNPVPDGTNLGESSSDLETFFDPNTFAVKPKNTDSASGGKWIYRIVINNSLGTFTGTVKIGTMPMQLVKYIVS